MNVNCCPHHERTDESNANDNAMSSLLTVGGMLLYDRRSIVHIFLLEYYGRPDFLILDVHGLPVET